MRHAKLPWRVLALPTLIALSGCSVVIDSSKYVGEGTDGGTSDGAIDDGAMLDGARDGSVEPPTLAPYASVALGDYAPMPADRVDVLFGPSNLGPATTLEWRLGSGEWATVVDPSIAVPEVASVGMPLFVRATWSPSGRDPIVRQATAIVQPREPTWGRVLPDVERAATAFWDPKNQRWVFAIDSLGETTWWELAVVADGHPRLVALPTPDGFADPRDGLGFVTVPDLDNDRLLLIGGTGPLTGVVAMSLASAGRLTFSEVGVAGTPPMAMRVPGATFVPSEEGNSVLVCGGLVDVEPPTASDVCALLQLRTGDAPTWTTAPSLPSALGGMTLFHVRGDTYAFGGVDVAMGVSSRIFRLAGDAWEDLDLGLEATDARGNAMVAQVGDRVSLIGGAQIDTEIRRAPGRLVLDFATSPPTVTRDALELPGGVNGAVGTVGSTVHVFDGSEPNDSAFAATVAFRSVASDGVVTPFFVFGETTPPPRVVALAGWDREGTSFVYGGATALSVDAEGGAWTFEDGIRPMPLEGEGPGRRSDIVIDTRANGGGFGGFTVVGGVRGDGIAPAMERTLWFYDDRWEMQSYLSGGPVPRRGTNVTRTQGCGAVDLFLYGGQDGSGNPSDEFEAWGCESGSCGWYSGALPTLPAASYSSLTWDKDRTLILLGGRGDGGAPIARLQVLDHCLSAASVWRNVPVAAPMVSRFAHTTTVLGQDSITPTLLVTGGLSAGGSTAPSLLVTLTGLTGLEPPEASIDSPPAGGPEGRAYHTALRNRDGDRVWIFGGQNGSGRVLGDAWVFRYPTP